MCRSVVGDSIDLTLPSAFICSRHATCRRNVRERASEPVISPGNPFATASEILQRTSVFGRNLNFFSNFTRQIQFLTGFQAVQVSLRCLHYGKHRCRTAGNLHPHAVLMVVSMLPWSLMRWSRNQTGNLMAIGELDGVCNVSKCHYFSSLALGNWSKYRSDFESAGNAKIGYNNMLSQFRDWQRLLFN